MLLIRPLQSFYRYIIIKCSNKRILYDYIVTIHNINPIRIIPPETYQLNIIKCNLVTTRRYDSPFMSISQYNTSNISVTYFMQTNHMRSSTSCYPACIKYSFTYYLNIRSVLAPNDSINNCSFVYINCFIAFYINHSGFMNSGAIIMNTTILFIHLYLLLRIDEQMQSFMMPINLNNKLTRISDNKLNRISFHFRNNTKLFRTYITTFNLLLRCYSHSLTSFIIK